MFGVGVNRPSEAQEAATRTFHERKYGCINYGRWVEAKDMLFAPFFSKLSGGGGGASVPTPMHGPSIYMCMYDIYICRSISRTLD